MVETLFYFCGVYIVGVFTGFYIYRKYKDAIELFINTFMKRFQ